MTHPTLDRGPGARRHLAPIVAAALFLAAPAARAAGGRPSVDALRWLAGCWQRVEEGRASLECWTPPAGGTMLGAARTVAGGATTSFEFMRIETRDGRLVYVAVPSGQRETVFTAVEVSGSAALFANPDHDFPQRVRYRLQPDGSLLAQIEGEVDGRTRVVDFPFQRAAWAAGAGASGSPPAP